jgi:hypothetical protein
MAGEPSHVKQLSLNHVCKIGLTRETNFRNVRKYTSILTRRVHLFQVNSVYLMPKLQIYVVTSGGVWIQKL